MTDSTFTWTDFDPDPDILTGAFSFSTPDMDILVCNPPDGIGLDPDFVTDILQDIFHLHVLPLTFELASELSIIQLMQRLTPPVYHKHRASIRRFLDLGQLHREVRKHGHSLTPDTKATWIDRLTIITQLNQGGYNSRERRAFHRYQAESALSTQPAPSPPQPTPTHPSFPGYPVQAEGGDVGEPEGDDDNCSHDSTISSQSNAKTSVRPKASRNLSHPKPRGSRDSRFAFLPIPDRATHKASMNLSNPSAAYSSPTNKIKGTLNVRITWNGNTSTFPAYRDAVEGFYTQEHSGYLFNKEFQALYREHGLYAAEHSDMPSFIHVTPGQLMEAASHMFGAIQASCRDSNTARKFLNAHRNTRDGILVWLDLVKNQDKDGNVQVHEAKLESKTRRTYDRNYKGGLIQYLEDVSDGFAGLEEIGNSYTEKQKMQTLLNNLHFDSGDKYLISHCRNTFSTFQQCYEYLRSEATQREEEAMTLGRRKANKSSTETSEKNPSSAPAPPSEWASAVERYLFKISSNSKDPRFRIPTEAWDLLVGIVGIDKLKEFMKKRDAIIVSQPLSTKKDEASPKPQNTDAPRQYTKKINLTSSESNPANTEDSEVTLEETMDDTDDNATDDLDEAARTILNTLSNLGFSENDNRSIFPAMTIHANLHMGDRLAHLLHKDPNLHVLIFDNGADTFVFGEGWEIISYTGQTANLVGFDTLHARKNHLQIVTAQTVIDHPSGEQLIIRVHQGVYNPGNNYTLASKFQCYEGGCAIDSTAKQHLKPDGSHGTQCIKFPGDPRKWDFEVRECLMTLQHRLPTMEEKETLPIIEITSKSPWNPHEHTFLYNDCPQFEPLPTETVNMSQALVSHATPSCTQDTGEAVPSKVGESAPRIQDVNKDLYFDPTDANDTQFQYFGDKGLVNQDMLLGEVPNLTLHPDFLCSSKIDAFLDNLDTDDLVGHHVQFDVNAYCIKAAQELRHIHPARTKKTKENLEDLRRCLAFLPMEVIRKTLDCTTRLAEWTCRLPMRRHFQARFPFLNLHRLREAVATDTYFASCKATGGATCAQVFFGCQSKMINVYPMKSESEGPNAYEDFLREEGIPSILRRDNSKMQSGHAFRDINRHFLVKDGFTEPHHPHQNPAELQAVKWIKDHSQVLMNRQNVPPYMWHRAAQYLAAINNITAHESLNWRTPKEKRHGVTPDISAYTMFAFWEPVYYLDVEESYPNSKELPGRFLGVADNSGDALTFLILSDDSGKELVRSMVRSAINPSRFGFPNARVQHREYPETPKVALPVPQINSRMSAIPEDATDDRFKGRKRPERGEPEDEEPIILIGPPEQEKHTPENPDNPNMISDSESDDEDDFPKLKPRVSNDSLPRNNRRPRKQKSPVEQESKVPEETGPRRSPRLKRVNNTKGKSANRLASSILALADVLSKNIVTTEPQVPFKEPWSSVQPQQEIGEELETCANTKPLRQLLVYHQMLDCLPIEQPDPVESYVWKVETIVSVCKQIRRTMVHVIWKNGGKSWINLKCLRLHDPFVCVMYAQKHNLMSDPEWEWTQDFLQDPKQFQRMVAVYQTTRSFAPKYKFGVEVPRSPKHALELDKREGNHMWEEAMKKELDQINEYGTFRKLLDDESLKEFKRIPYHFVFDVKFDLRRKARLVAGGNHTDLPKDDTYSGVVSLESIRTLFVLASMNHLDIWAADVGNAFLYGKTKEKVYVIAGPEFGPELVNKPLVIYKSLYGLKSASARFHEHLAVRLRDMGFRPSKADHDLWLRLNGDHYEYIATWVDDLLVASRNPNAIMDELRQDYILKGVGIPEYYLGGNVDILGEQWEKEGIKYALSAQTYVKNVVEKFETLFGQSFAQYKVPMASDYHPELDDSPLCDAEMASRYRSMTGSLNWAISLGRFDIQYATSVLARYNAAPREGHIKAMKQIFGYLKKFSKAKSIVDPTLPNHGAYLSENYDNWKEFYPDAEEAIPPDIPKPVGAIARITIWVDADHARDKLTRRSVTGIVLMVNGMIIKTISKRQATVETSTYGSELVAARIATELAIEFRYNLRMLGVPLDGPVLMLGDNNSVVLNTTIPSSMLKKKHNAVAYHRVREAIAAGIVRFCHIPSQRNLADVLTKPLDFQSAYPLLKATLFNNPGENRWPGKDIEVA